MRAQTIVVAPQCIPPAPRRRHVLLVDDDPRQLKLTAVILTATGYDVSTASGASEALDQTRFTRPDAILSDVVMGELDGFALCSLFRCDPALASVPILLVSANVDASDRDIAVASGAWGLVQRSPGFRAELTALGEMMTGQADVPAIQPQPQPEPSVSRMASQMAHLLARSRSAEDRYKTLFDNASEALAVLTPEGTILEVNRRWEEILQRPCDQVVGRHIREFAPTGSAADNVNGYQRALAGHLLQAVPIAGPDAVPVYMDFSSRVVSVAGEEVVLAIGRDVTEQVVARRNLAASEEKYRTLIENIPDVVWSATLYGRLTFLSRQVLHVCGFSPEELMAASPSFWFERTHPEDRTRVAEALAAIAVKDFAADYRWQHKAGHWIWLRSHASLRIGADGARLVEGTFADVTEHKRLEEELRQAQKMEAVGRLTGGIAHDFNNMLTVILGNGELLRDDLPEGDRRRADIDAVLDAGRRAAGLTRQLLAFSRRQIIEPQVLDLGEIVGGIEKMFGRLIGEDIALSVSRADQLWPVRVDAGQAEQVIMNLVVNARDAMPRGGRLAIGTANVVLDADRASTLSVPPGEYVTLAIADSGCGMSAETKRRLFEPFFTTKEVGKGTGLGLSTCYGIVKQSGGAIAVESEVGNGSTFKVFLPRTTVRFDATRVHHATRSETLAGGETILLVEDNLPLRKLARRVLSTLGYTILEARDGGEAIAIADQFSGAIDLVLSDVVVPGLSGPDIVTRIQNTGRRPKVLFMSGYTEHAMLQDCSMQASMNFIQKPFAPAAIARKVREVLDAGSD